MTNLFIESEEHCNENGYNFDYNYDWCNRNGWTISTPIFFGMGFFYEDKGDVVLFVSYCRGDMRSLFRFSSDYEIHWIEFKRGFSGKVKRLDFAKFERKMYGN